MKGLWTLVKMQLKEKLDLSFLKSRKATVFKLTYFVLGFTFVTAAIFALFYASVMLHLLTLTSTLPLSLLVFLFSTMFLLNLATTTYSLMNALYFSGDNQVLLTLPVNSNVVFFSKMIVYYVYELKKHITFMLPLFIAFGLVNKFSWGYFPVLILSFLLITLVSVALAALLTIPCSYVAAFFRERRYLQVILAALAMLGAIYVFVLGASSIPTNIDLIGTFGKYYWQIQAFLTNFSARFKPFALLITMVTGSVSFASHKPITGTSVLIFFCTLLIGAALIALSYLLTRPLFFKMVSKPLEYKFTRQSNNKKNTKLPMYLSSLKKELVLKARTPALLVKSVVSVFILPFAIFLLNRFFAAMNTRLLGDLAALAANFFLTLLILLNGNSVCAAIFSSEGKAVQTLKTAPESLRSNIAAKLTVTVVLSTISVMITGKIIALENSLSSQFSILLTLTFIAINLAHIFWSVELDITNPQYTHFINGIHTTGNPNETKSTLVAFALCFVITIIFTFLMVENYYTVPIKVFIMSLVLLAARAYLLACNGKVYFREI